MAPAAPASDKLRHRVRSPGIKLDCGAGPEVPHVGIVFVHGIGSQAAAETLLDWGGAIVRVLSDARAGHHAAADPVLDAQLDPGPGESRFIEVQLPAIETEDGATVPEQHWVMTEAWWAQRVRPPSFRQMADWLGTGGAITRIVDALIAPKRGAGDPRLRPAAEVRPLHIGPGGVEEEPDAGTHTGSLSPFATLARWVAALGGNLYLRALSALLLVLYGVLRAVEKLVPIGPLKDGALTRPLDGFVLDWFGDVYVLLGDSAQAASVRGRLVDGLTDLDLAGCDRIAVVAHSGGAIVSYMTLTDPAHSLRVDRLITLGEGLNLAWNLVDGKGSDGAAVESERLSRNVFAAHPKLRWDDFWASQDPAPVGVLRFSSSNPPDDRTLGRIESHATWNMLSLSEDHGGYWDNDEEFVIPLLRLLEKPDGTDRPAGTEPPAAASPAGAPPAAAASLFGDPADDDARSNRRRRRLSILSLLRQSCSIAPLSGIVAAFAIGSNSVLRLGDAVATAWNAIPGTRFASDAIDYVRGQHPEDTPAIRFLAEAGVWVVAAVIAGTAAFALLAPPERPLPWRRGGILSRGLWLSLRVGPYLAGIAGLALVVYGGVRFLSGSTVSALDVGNKLLIGAAAVAVLAVGLGLLSGLRGFRATGLGYAINVLTMAAFMVLASALVVAPAVAAVVFVDVGRTVVGSLAVVAAFGVIGRVGSWRWGVWDARERSAARRGRPYGSTGRILTQTLLMAAIVVGALAAVILDSPVLAVAAVVALVGLALMGVAIDVLDAVREEQEGPPDAINGSRLRV